MIRQINCKFGARALVQIYTVYVGREQRGRGSHKAKKSSWRDKERRRRPVAVTVLLPTSLAFPSPRTHGQEEAGRGAYTYGGIRESRRDAERETTNRDIASGLRKAVCEGRLSDKQN